MRRAAALTALAVLSSSCSGGGASAPTTTTTVAVVLDSVPPITDRSVVGPAELDAARRAVISADDLPVDWAVAPSTDHRTRVDLASCAPEATGMAFAAGDDLVAPDGSAVAQEVAVSDEVVASDVVGDLRDARAAPCVGDAARRVVETQIAAVPGTPRELVIGGPTVFAGRFTPVGEESVAFEVAFPVTIDGVATDLYVDVVVVRVAGSLAVLTARRASAAPTVTDLAELSALMAARLAAR